MVGKVILVQVGWSGRSINHRWTPDVPAWNKPPPTVFYVLSLWVVSLCITQNKPGDVFTVCTYLNILKTCWIGKNCFLVCLFFCYDCLFFPFCILFLLSFFVLAAFLTFYVFDFIYVVEILLCVFFKQSITWRSHIFCGKNVIKHSATTNNGDRIWFKICVQCIEKIEDPCRLGE